MRVTVDRDLCEANGVCAGLVPAVFRPDDQDELHITDGDAPPRLADQLRHAVQSCPKTALTLSE